MNVKRSCMIVMLCAAVLLGMQSPQVFADAASTSWYTSDGVKSSSETTAVTSSTTEWKDGVYVSEGKTEIDEKVTVKGDVTLVLKDNSDLTCKKGIIVEEEDSSLTIATPGKDGNGKLNTTGDDSAGIGSGFWEHTFNGKITIEGGNISAKGHNASAGIGSGGLSGDENNTDGEINIHGGTVHAVGDAAAAGIGGGMYELTPVINITGGNITAESSNNAAAIGNGFTDNNGKTGKSINISNANVSAMSETQEDNKNTGAGIGPGYGNNVESINIDHSTINATGIGGAQYGSTEKIDISNSEVTSTSWNQNAGIGNGQESKNASSINISSSKVTATGSDLAAGIGSGRASGFDTITIRGSIISARGGMKAAAIGSGMDGSGNTITLENSIIGASAVKPENTGATAIGCGLGISGGSNRNSVDTIKILSCKVDAKGGYNAAAIGGSKNSIVNKINITGGEITAAGNGGAGIGGAQGESAGKITIETATIHAGNSGHGPGIGSGFSCSSQSEENNIITIKSGDITATGGGSAAGIGSGGPSSSGVGKINILGGTIRAIGGDISGNDGNKGSGGAGIGGGANQSGWNTVISGGSVTATGGASASGIGGGAQGATGGLTIIGGRVQATGGYKGAGIGSGSDYKSNGSQTSKNEVIISGGTVTAKAGDGASGIGGGSGSVCQNISIEGGDVTATGGTLTYTGNDGKPFHAGGAGIGTGIWAQTDNTESAININGGTVHAYGADNAAGVGGGCGAGLQSIFIDGGVVTAKGGVAGAGIGSGIYGGKSQITIQGGTAIAEAGKGAFDIGDGKSANEKTTFSTGKDGCAVLIAKTFSDESKKDEWTGIHFTGKGGEKGKRGVLLNHKKITVHAEEMIPDGYILDIYDEHHDYVKFSVPKSYFRNAGKIYVWGTHDNIDDRELTNIGGGEVIYPETPRPIISYTVTFKVDGKTALETEVPAGTPVSRPDIKAPEGSTLDGWYTDQACTTPYDFTKDLNREITLYARTEKNPVKKRILTLAVTTKGKTAQVLRWSSVNDADGYTVYAAPCNGTWKRMKSVKGTTASGRTCVMKKRTPGKSYKYLVKAYRKENGKKIYFMKSLVAHSIANNQSKTYTNAKAIRIGASDMTMNAGSKAKIVKKTVRWNAKKRLLKTASHAPYYRYLVDAPEIASVKNGVITAKKSGTCKIYVTAQNGLFKVINVTVK